MMTHMFASLIAPMISVLIQFVASLLIIAMSGEGQEGDFLPLLALPLMLKVLEKEIRGAGRGCTNMDKNI